MLQAGLEKCQNEETNPFWARDRADEDVCRARKSGNEAISNEVGWPALRVGFLAKGS
jgi:hypothetical protein